MIANCPHCFTRVLLTLDEPCPTCRKVVTQELIDGCVGLITITLDEGTEVPGHCFLCDRPRTKVLKVHVQPRSGALSITDVQSKSEERSVASGAVLRFLLGLATGRILVGKFDEDPGMRVYLPSCEMCESRLHICHVSSRDRSITVLANEKFADRILECKNSRTPRGS